MNSKKILLNTIIINAQTIISLLLSLYTSRIILNALGVLDFGIYNIVGGVVAMFGFLNNSMTVSNQRYFSFELGKKNTSALIKLFNASIVIHFFIALIILALAETIGIYILKHYINIPLERKDAAMWIYHFSILSFICNILTVPYRSIINSYENISTIAIISVVNSFMLLIASISVSYLTIDKLKIYAILIFFINFIVFLLYLYIIKSKYKHLTHLSINDKSIYKDMLSFSGWNLSGAVAMVGKNQGIGIILNLFIGPTINAAYGIANQINSAVTSFSQAIISASNPQITKNYSSGSTYELNLLIYQTSKISYLFLLIISIPLIFNTNYILEIWLKNVPPHSSIFCRLILINALFEILSYPLMTLAQATGKIKYYQISNSILLLAILPIAYYLLHAGFEPHTILIVMIIISGLTLLTRLMFVRYLAAFSFSKWVKEVLLRILIPTVLSILSINYVEFLINLYKINSITFILLNIIIVFTFSYLFGFVNEERRFIKSKFISMFWKLSTIVGPK